MSDHDHDQAAALAALVAAADRAQHSVAPVEDAANGLPDERQRVQAVQLATEAMEACQALHKFAANLQRSLAARDGN